MALVLFISRFLTSLRGLPLLIWEMRLDSAIHEAYSQLKKFIIWLYEIVLILAPEISSL